MLRLNDDEAEVVITIPAVPGRALSPNARVHWGDRKRAVAVLHDAAFWATYQLTHVEREWLFFGYRTAEPGMVIDAEIRWPKGRKRMDDDNAWAMLKAARDGVAHAADINDKTFVSGELTQVRGTGEVVFRIRRTPRAGHEV